MGYAFGKVFSSLLILLLICKCSGQYLDENSPPDDERMAVSLNSEKFYSSVAEVPEFRSKMIESAEEADNELSIEEFLELADGETPQTIKINNLSVYPDPVIPGKEASISYDITTSLPLKNPTIYFAGSIDEIPLKLHYSLCKVVKCPIGVGNHKGKISHEIPAFSPGGSLKGTVKIGDDSSFSSEYPIAVEISSGSEVEVAEM